MAQQIKIGTNGANSMRVLDALTPLIGDGAPDSVVPNYIGQLYIDTTGKVPYVSVALTGGDEWYKLEKSV